MFSELKWGAAIAGALALFVAGLFAWNEHQDIVAQQAQIAKHDACLSALGGKGDVATTCDAIIIAAFDRAQHSDTCDQALALGGTAPECSQAVAELFGNYATVKAQLQSTVADRDAAIGRAAARAASDATRKAQDENALAKAPRLSDGLIVCDALCLRQRFEADAQ
jgi:hypothetical protein